MKCEISYLNLVDEALGSALHSLRLLDLGDLLKAGLVVPTLAPYIDVLVTIVGVPLDLYHLIVRDRLAPSPSTLPPTTVEGIIGPLPWSGAPSCVEASTGGSSTQAGDGVLFSSSATLLDWGVPTVPSSLIGALVSAPIEPGPR